MAEKKMNRDEASLLCSVGVVLLVTLRVDGTKRVHAMRATSVFLTGGPR